MNNAASWIPIETAPKDGTEILVLFDSASVDIVRLCWWDDGAPEPWGDNQPRPGDVGWWSYQHSVTQELINVDLMAPIGWMPHPPRLDISE
jgi:hypothetical protein